MCGDMNLREFYSYIATSLPSTALDPPFHDQPAHLEIYAGLSTKVLSEHIAEKKIHIYIFLKKYCQAITTVTLRDFIKRPELTKIIHIGLQPLFPVLSHI